MNTHSTCKGLTLIDILITMAIVAIVGSFAIPSMQSMANKNRMATVANDFVGALQLARSEAIKRGEGRVLLKKIGAEWESGWTVFVDYDDNEFINDDGDSNLCEVREDCRLREYLPLKSGYTIRPKNSRFTDWVGYRPSGQSTGNGGANGTFYICPRDGNLKQARKVVINMVGRIRTSPFEAGDVCPS